MLDQAAFQRLYTSYGFETVNSDDKQISVFVYKKSRYFGVDIIPTSISDEVIERAKKIQDEYSKSGYAANLKEIKSIDEAEIELFKSFFAYDSTTWRF